MIVLKTSRGTCEDPKRSSHLFGGASRRHSTKTGSLPSFQSTPAIVSLRLRSTSCWERRPANINDIHGAGDAALKFDHAIYGLRAVLDPHVLHGYHCTRLTEQEIGHIVANGMQLPNASVLSERIQNAQEAGLIDRHAADRLRAEGSGKTVVLALKAAYLHARNPQ